MTALQAPRLRYVCLAVIALPLGLAVRYAPHGLPYAVRKYGGSALWAALIFFVLSFVVPARTVVSRMTAAMTTAFSIELFKLVHRPALDAFRETLAGQLLLGRVFSVRDLCAYAVAIALAGVLDARLSRWRALPSSHPMV